MADYQGTDFYCDVAVPKKVDLRIEYEDDFVLSFHHTQPHWPIHIVVVPKKHILSFTNRAGDDDVVNKVLKVVEIIARKVEKQEGSCRIITNLGNYQDSKHLHFHICSGNYLK